MASNPKAIEADHFSDDVRDFLRVLHKHSVAYVIVGGEAVIFHGYARFTGDVDFFYSDSEENTERLYTALTEFWSGPVPGVESAKELREPGIVVQFGRAPNRLDLLNTIDGVQFDEAWKGRLELQVDFRDASIPVYMLSLGDLLRNKMASGRPKDLEDLLYLKARHGPS